MQQTFLVAGGEHLGLEHGVEAVVHVRIINVVAPH